MAKVERAPRTKDHPRDSQEHIKIHGWWKETPRLEQDGNYHLSQVYFATLTDVDELRPQPRFDQEDPWRHFQVPEPAVLDPAQQLHWQAPETIGQMTSLLYLNVSNSRLTTNGLPVELQSTQEYPHRLRLNHLDSVPTTHWALWRSSMRWGSMTTCLVRSNSISKLPKLKKSSTQAKPLSQGRVIGYVHGFHQEAGQSIWWKRRICVELAWKYQLTGTTLNKIKEHSPQHKERPSFPLWFHPTPWPRNPRKIGGDLGPWP